MVTRHVSKGHEHPLSYALTLLRFGLPSDIGCRDYTTSTASYFEFDLGVDSKAIVSIARKTIETIVLLLAAFLAS